MASLAACFVAYAPWLMLLLGLALVLPFLGEAYFTVVLILDDPTAAVNARTQYEVFAIQAPGYR